MTRLTLALLLLAGVCGAQQQATTVKQPEPLKQCLDVGKKLLAELKSCREEVNLTIEAFDQCTAEENKPHLPLSVNPGDCFEVQADMSIKLIECPKEQ